MAFTEISEVIGCWAEPEQPPVWARGSGKVRHGPSERSPNLGKDKEEAETEERRIDVGRGLS